MGLKVGIVGLPNVGKSTIFNALTHQKVPAENYPFCTIDPHVGLAPVADERLEYLARVYQSQDVIPAVVEFVDIAGLVKGAHQGEGLGNQFLSHIRQVHAIAQVLRCFENENVIHVHSHVDPIRDREIILTELILADLQTLEKKKDPLKKAASSGQKLAQLQWEFLQQLENHLNQGGLAIQVVSDQPEIQNWRKSLHLLTDKPMIYVLNVSEEDLKSGQNPWVAKLKPLLETQQARYVVVSAAIEAELAQLSLEERKLFLAEFGLTQSALDRFVQESYALLGLITFFTAGPKEARAWTIKKGTLAPQAAGVIHSDFERGFIRAEVFHIDDLKELGSEEKVRQAGRLRLEGKDYEIQDGDVVYFRFNV